MTNYVEYLLLRAAAGHCGEASGQFDFSVPSAAVVSAVLEREKIPGFGNSAESTDSPPEDKATEKTAAVKLPAALSNEVQETLLTAFRTAVAAARNAGSRIFLQTGAGAALAEGGAALMDTGPRTAGETVSGRRYPAAGATAFEGGLSGGMSAGRGMETESRDMSEISAFFERDSRRYDYGFEKY